MLQPVQNRNLAKDSLTVNQIFKYFMNLLNRDHAVVHSVEGFTHVTVGPGPHEASNLVLIGDFPILMRLGNPCPGWFPRCLLARSRIRISRAHKLNKLLGEYERKRNLLVSRCKVGKERHSNASNESVEEIFECTFMVVVFSQIIHGTVNTHTSAVTT